MRLLLRDFLIKENALRATTKFSSEVNEDILILLWIFSTFFFRGEGSLD